MKDKVLQNTLKKFAEKIFYNQNKKPRIKIFLNKKRKKILRRARRRAASPPPASSLRVSPPGLPTAPPPFARAAPPPSGEGCRRGDLSDSAAKSPLSGTKTTRIQSIDYYDADSSARFINQSISIPDRLRRPTVLDVQNTQWSILDLQRSSLANNRLTEAEEGSSGQDPKPLFSFLLGTWETPLWLENWRMDGPCPLRHLSGGGGPTTTTTTAGWCVAAADNG